MTSIGMDTRLPGNERFLEMARVLLSETPWTKDEVAELRRALTLAYNRARYPQTCECTHPKNRHEKGTPHGSPTGPCWQEDDVGAICGCEQFREGVKR